MPSNVANDSAITQLPPVVSLSLSNVFPVVASGVTSQATVSQLIALVGSGTVSSVGLSAPAELTVGGSPVTTSGVISLSWASQTQNKVFASPNGSSGTPTFRALVNADLANSSVTYNGKTVSLGGSATLSLASADFVNQGTTSTVLHGNAAGNPSFSAVALATDVSGTLQATNFGTLTGDVTTPGGSYATTIANDAVTYAKMQNISAASLLLGRGAGGGSGDPQEIVLGTNLSMSGTTLNAASGGTTLNQVTAATGSATIASGNNTGIVWNWANTADSTVAFTFGETSAATNGTSTSGVPNQVLLKLNTVAASTQSPLSVYSRASHVFSVSPSASQILAADGSQANPIYSFSGATGTGMRRITASGGIQLTIAGSPVAGFTSSTAYFRDSSSFAANALSITEDNLSSTGVNLMSGTGVGIGVLGVENSRFIAGILQASKGSADAVSYSLNFRKSRGTVAAPTVVSTNDFFGQISGYAYVGATNTYLEGARISFKTGGVSDSAQGINGDILFWSTLGGTDSSPQEGFRLTGGSSPQIYAKSGSASLPIYSFASATTNGMYYDGIGIGFAVGGGRIAAVTTQQLLAPSGSATVTALSDTLNGNSGLYWPATNVLGVNNATDGEWARFASRIFQVSRGSADATAYAINARKSRGTVAAPTVITTGDDLATISGYGYVGGTNTYLEAARITFDSTGTITDATTGIGGIIRFSTTTQGTDSSVQEVMRLQGGSTAPQILGFGTGTAFSFATLTNYGMGAQSNMLQFYAAGVNSVGVGAGGLLVTDGSTSAYSWFGIGDSATTSVLTSSSTNPSITVAQTVSGTAGATIKGAKSRAGGVITTGDSLISLKGFGYVGGTNTYLEAARIELVSAGTITDATTGIGSVIKFKGTTQGTDTGVQDTLIITGGSTATLQIKGSGMVAANGSVATVLGSVGPAGANTTVQEWLAVKNSAGTTRYIPMF